MLGKSLTLENPPGPATLISLAGGEFLRGSADHDPLGFAIERPRQPVRLSPFRMGATPVTRAFYRELTGRWLADWEDDHGQLPATHLSWPEAVDFCNRLSRLHGLAPCYRRGRWWRLERVRDADGYRLPSEAEWEYVARAGYTHRFGHGDDPAGLAAIAWYADNADNRLHPVASRAANAWGLYDLQGLVWEWCEDWWQPYDPGPVTDPLATMPSDARVVRGGAYTSTARDLRVAARNGYPPATTSRRVGFRLVRPA